MVTFVTQRDFRAPQNLPFCYVCGEHFTVADDWDRDHVPARKLFAARDRDRGPVLWLPTHRTCNNGHSETDKKVGQLIGVRWGKRTSDRKLDIRIIAPGFAAVMNVNIRQIVLRWITAFHAALYREPLIEGTFVHHIVTPYPTAPKITGIIHPLLPQHEAFVHTIKEQRALRNVDRLSYYNGKIAYECVWTQFDNRDQWLCVFALDLYDWKDLGRTPGQPLRGCAGFYAVEGAPPPATATRRRGTAVMIPNFDTRDAFAP